MAHARSLPPLGANDFLRWEAEQPERHEYLDGEVFAMAGAGDNHVTVALNLAIALRQHLAGTPCRAYMSDMRLQVAEANSYFYPDLMVTCSAADRASDLQKSEPLLLVEVLSPSTAAYDRGAKFAAYRQLPSLREYLLVDIDSRSCDLYRRGEDGLWVLHPSAGDEPLALASVELTIPATAVFAELLEPAAQ